MVPRLSHPSRSCAKLSLVNSSLADAVRLVRTSLPHVASALGETLVLLRGLREAGVGEVDAWMSDWLGEDFDARIARVPRSHGDARDPFGLDPEWVKRTLAVVGLLHRNYFRTEVFGRENLPEGRVLLIANHSGQIPIDGALIGAAMFMDMEPPRFVRAMVERWSQSLPFVATFFSRVGQVVGIPENAKELLERDEALLVFPEGVRGISKPFSKRYQLQDFGLGFMRLAIETGTPIVPVAVIGGEEQYISLANFGNIGKMVGLPSLPVIPQLLVPGGQLPLPTRYRLHFGKPMQFAGDHEDEDAVMRIKVEQVRAELSRMIAHGLEARTSIFF